MTDSRVAKTADLINRCAQAFGGFAAGVLCTFLFFALSNRSPQELCFIGNKPAAAPVQNVQAGNPAMGQNRYQNPPATAPQAPVQFNDLDGKPSLGPANAPVTLVEFSDFMCPFSKRVQPTMDQIVGKYREKVRRIWFDFPLPMHQGAARIHEAAACAGEQKRFWEFRSLLFNTPSMPTNDQALADLAKHMGLDTKAFQTCLSSNKYSKKVQDDVARGQQIGVRGTPAFFINGKMIVGAQPYENFEKIIDEELSGPKKAS